MRFLKTIFLTGFLMLFATSVFAQSTTDELETCYDDNLGTVMNKVIVSSYDMTVDSGLELMKTILNEYYPRVIGDGSIACLRFKKEALKFVVTALYEELIKKAANYSDSESGLKGTDYIHASIYDMLKTVVILPETFPGHKTAIYEIFRDLGLSGVSISAGGVTEINVPENLKL